MSISVSDLQKLQDIVNEQLKSAGSSIEELITALHSAGSSIDELITALHDGAQAKRIAEQNSEGDHTQEAIDYLKKH